MDRIAQRAGDTKALERAILALGLIGNDQVGDFVVEVLNDDDVMLRMAALATLREIGLQRHASQVAELLRDQSASIRKEAVKTLAVIGDEAALADLRTFVGDEDRPFLKNEALAAITALEQRFA
jgi:HEAT repeat protein